MHPLYEFFRRRYQERSSDFPWDLDEKLKGKAFAQSAGVAVPKTLQVISAVSDLQLLEVGGRRMVKPAGMHSAKGTFALVPAPGDVAGRFLNLLWPRGLISRDDIVGLHSAKWAEFDGHNPSIPHAVIVEDLASSPMGHWSLPLDVKFYFVAGEVAFVLVINRNCEGGARYGMFDSNMQDAKSMVASCSVPVTGERPALRNVPALFDAARSIGRELQTPFASVDLYESDGGPVFGEITPAPGGPFAWSLGLRGMWKFHGEILDDWWARIGVML